MKAYFTASPASPASQTRSIYTEPSIPHWISDMGLEWLYLMLAGSSNGTVKTIRS